MANDKYIFIVYKSKYFKFIIEFFLKFFLNTFIVYYNIIILSLSFKEFPF